MQYSECSVSHAMYLILFMSAMLLMQTHECNVVNSVLLMQCCNCNAINAML